MVKKRKLESSPVPSSVYFDAEGNRTENAAEAVRGEVVEHDAKAGRTVIGFSFGREPLNPSVPEAARLSADLMWTVTTGTVEANSA